MYDTIRKTLLVLLQACSLYAFAGADTVVVPLQRQLFHERIDAELSALDKTDGKLDQFIKVTANEEINQALSDIMFHRTRNLADSVELNPLIPRNNEKVRYLSYIEKMIAAYRVGWISKEFNPLFAQMLVTGFEKAMKDNINGTSIAEVIADLPYETGNILTTIFSDNPGYKECKKILFLKYSSIHPDRIIDNIKPYCNEPFADSLVTVCSRYNPTAVYNAAQASETPVGKLIRRNNNKVIKTILAISESEGALLYFPFLDDLVSGKITIQDIKKYAGNGENGYDSVGYFKLLVRTEMEYFRRMASPQKDTPIAFLGANGLREMLKQKALKHFITPINELHAQPNLAVRMKAIEPLSPADLYYMLVMGETEIYTSSYKHSFERMMQRMGANPRGDSLLLHVYFDQFRKFIKMAANFNKLDDFLKTMPLSKSSVLMQAFVANLDKTGNLEDAVDVADAYSSINNKKLLKTILCHVTDNEIAAISNNNDHGKMVYGLLKIIFRSADSSSTIDLAKETGIPPIFKIETKDLADDSNRIIQQVFFYGDQDGQDYFKSFMSSFSPLNWNVYMKPEWAEIRSLRGQKILIYANRPLDSDTNLDDTAQLHLFQYLLNNDLHPSIVIHRGHSYWLPHTLQMMPDDVKIVILGSCGGYNDLKHVLEFSPDAHIISTKEIGKGDINKPIINYINQALLAGKPLVWKTMWATLTKQFATADAETRQSWEDYIPPYRNLGALFIKAYNKKNP